MNKLILCLVISFMLVGCKQNPYDASAIPGQKIVTDNPSNNHQTPKVFSIEAPDFIECTEGSACGAEIHGHVPAPGNAMVQIKGLPAGAVYDAVTGVVSYTPGFEVVNVAEHPEQSMMLMQLSITVRSSSDAVTETSRTVTLIVKNKMQTVEMIVTGASTVDEAKTLEQTVEIKSADFPQGPFSLTTLNAPIGTEVKAVAGNPNLFKVKFTPGFIFTGANGSKSIDFYYNASLPIGQSISKAVKWTVYDVRQSPTISAPEAMTGGLDVSFSIRAEDMNGEIAPKITVNSTVPFGRITTTSIAETSGQGVTFPSKVVLVRWDQIKASQLGTTTPISYDVCVQKSGGNPTLCTQKKVMVTLKADLHPAPKIDRSAWKIGDLKFLRVGTPVTLKMPILDVEDQNMPVDVKISSSQPTAIGWKNGVLTVNPASEGILQFAISAESIFGQTLTENFVVEVFPAAWAKTVILTSDTVQNESIEIAKLISSLDLLSVKFQVSARTLAMRESCVLTTEALGVAKVDEKFQDRLYQNFPFIVVSTPLLGNLKGKIQADLKSYGVKIKGRLSTVVSPADISTMSLVVDPKSNLESPKVPAGLKGALTAESKDPIVFDLTQLSPKCIPLFNLQKPGASVAVGVTCKADDGKRLTVLGFELADVLLEKNDTSLLMKWTNMFLTGKGF